jgi:hypothetical protein
MLQAYFSGRRRNPKPTLAIIDFIALFAHVDGGHLGKANRTHEASRGLFKEKLGPIVCGFG